jgi:hypothetical protein
MGAFLSAAAAALLAVVVAGLLGFLNYRIQKTPGAGWVTFGILTPVFWLFFIPIIANLLR